MYERLPRPVEAVLMMTLAEFDPDERAITVLAPDPAALAVFVRAANGAGLRIAGSILLGRAPPDMPFGDIVLVDIRGLPPTDVAALLRPIEDQVPMACQLLVCASLDNLDDAIDTCSDAVDFMVGADEIELHLMLATALRRARDPSSPAHDITNEEGLRLQRLADEIAHIARTLIDLPSGLGNAASLSDRLTGYRAPPPDGEAGRDLAAITAGEVRAIIRLRRMRDRFFSPELFADPAWDMLLDLAAARIERVRVAVSSLCIAAAVPPTTALRWIKAMTDRGLLRRVADPHDARRIFIQLSDEAAAAMDKYLRAARVSAGTSI